MAERRGPALHQSARMELQLAPQLLQSIQVLALPTTELEGWLADAARRNPALRLSGGGPAGAGEEGPGLEGWLEGPAQGLGERLAEELSWFELPAEEEAWVRLVLASLDERGYLTLSDEALLAEAAEEGLPGGATELGRAIAFVQQEMEPRGIGGRNAVEALLLQLDPTEPDYALSCRLIEDFLEELAAGRRTEVAAALGVDVGRLEELLERLRTLDPAPGTSLAERRERALVPEVVVEPEGTGWRVRVVDAGLPAVTLDPAVRELARDRQVPPDERRALRGHLERARWILSALEERKRTLLRISEWVFRHQVAFLERGRGGLRPLRMGEVAESLGLHPSTVSRAVAGKYAWTPHGVVALRGLFPRRARGSRPEASVEDAREALREVVAAEDPNRPLSDAEIVDRLAAQGYQFARRTVAKVRRDLGIPSSYRRRRG